MPAEFSFDASRKTLNEVFFSNYKYQVPRYQRPYAWTEDEAADFWTDLTTNQGSFFLGSFIFSYGSLKNTGYIDIIDGQQRLLCITILCSVLRDIAKELDEDKANLFQRHDISIEDHAGHFTYRLRAGDSARPFVEQYIQRGDQDPTGSEPQNPEQRRIKRTYMYFRNKVQSDLTECDKNKDKVARLSKLREKLRNLPVIHIRIENEEDAYEIFEGVNARGVDLSVSDLLKNLIFKKLPPKGEKDFAKTQWQHTINNIQSTGADFKKFIRQYWISKHPTITEKRLFREIKQEIKDWEDLLTDIWDSSHWYNKMLEGSRDDWELFKHGGRIYKSLRAIRIMDVSQCYVFLLSVLRNHEKLGTDSARVFELIEKFTFQYHAICKLPANRVEKIYSRYANALEESVRTPAKKRAGNVQAVFAALEKELKGQKPLTQLFKENFGEVQCKNSEKSRKFVKYVLGRINDFYSETREMLPDFDNVNIEHVLPQDPDKNWRVDKKGIKDYVNLIGNLTLVDKRINSRIGNKTIKDKIGELEKSQLPITKKLVQQLRKNDEWNKDTIRKRQVDFAELGYKKIWHL